MPEIMHPTFFSPSRHHLDPPPSQATLFHRFIVLSPVTNVLAIRCPRAVLVHGGQREPAGRFQARAELVHPARLHYPNLAELREERRLRDPQWKPLQGWRYVHSGSIPPWSLPPKLGLKSNHGIIHFRATYLCSGDAPPGCVQG